MAEGWTYGEQKDAQNLKNPLLVPYEELPESEKDYDRNTALETLKLVMKLGYEFRVADAPGGCLKTASRQMRVPICANFTLDEGGVVVLRRLNPS